MRPPVFRGFSLLPGEMVVDNFAGGGGASTGIEAALGRPVDIAINHSPEAIAMHKANHPETKHFCENIWEVDPVEACCGRPVGLAWFSPDCRHFSKAKGTVPLKKEIRGLAWVVIRWAKAVKPRVIVLENVSEFQTWGPLGEDGRPLKERMGETFREWLAALADAGYQVEFRELVAADYGSPTIRKRLFLIARRDAAPAIWPAATHGRGRANAWRSAAEIIDWSLPCRSIFGRKKPLAEATMARIAKGIQRFVTGAADPFIVSVKTWGGGGNEPRSVDVRHGHYSHRTGAGLREGCGAGTFRGQSLGDPLATVCATNDKHLVAPIITKHYGGVVGHGVERPIGTITSRDHHALTTAWLLKYYGTSTGADLRDPMPTVTTGGGRGGGHIAEVRAFLMKYYGNGGKGGQNMELFDPLHAVTTKSRFGLVTVHGIDYQIVDITMRMLVPDELFGAQGFPDDYIIDPEFNGKPLTVTAQTALAGNSVCPQVAEALIAANCRQAPRMERAA